MNNADYGYAAIEARYKWLFDESPPSSFPTARMLDLDSVIEALHGPDYAPHPKLKQLAALNKLSQRYWLQGAEEPAKATEGDLAAVQRSTSEKARAVAKLARLLLDGDLATQESVGDNLLPRDLRSQSKSSIGELTHNRASAPVHDASTWTRLLKHQTVTNRRPAT